ncbi:hypothetical protein ACA910_012265 [Epithemia clementina (nom. ined.)]
MQRYVERHLPGIRIEVIGQHQNQAKWVHPARDLQQCFVRFRNFVFSGGVYDETSNFTVIGNRQSKWLGDNASLLVDIQTPTQINYLKSLLDEQEKQQRGVHNRDDGDHDYSAFLPYLTSQQLDQRT